MTDKELLEPTNVIWEWLAIDNPPEKADIIFLFGGAILNIAQKGAELMKKNLAPIIITTGNTGTFGNPEWKEPIAKVFSKYSD